jgi:hypothetical protein
MQQEAWRASRVSLATLIDRLNAISCDPSVPAKRQDAALAQLAKILTLTGTPGPQRQGPQAQGLTGEVVETIETQLLGIRPEPP